MSAAHIFLSLYLGLTTPLFLLGEFKRAVLSERYDEAVLISERINYKYLPADNRHQFFCYRASAFHQLGDKNKTVQALKDYKNQFGQETERDKAIVFLIDNDMLQWTDKELDAPVRKMRAVASRLRNDFGGPITQAKQKEIVEDLDRIIKETEDSAKNADKIKGDGFGDEDGDKPEGQSQNGQKNSKGGTDSGKGNVDEKKLTKLGQEWGKLPPKERAKALQELTREMPSKYRELVENYFRRLARDENDK